MREAALSLYLLLVLAAERVGAGKPPKAYLINLPKHAERYRTVKAQLESAGMRYERIGAVDGKALSTTEMKANVTALARVLLTRGMIGCFLSHRKCWQHCLEEADGPVLVFEDDVVLADNFQADLAAAMAELPADWDVLLLGALGAVHPNYYAVNLPHAMLAGGCRIPRGAQRVFGPRGEREEAAGRRVALHEPLRPFGTHAYAISERGARKLLHAAPRANYHVDVVAWGMRSLRLFAVHPLLAKQTHGDTTIGGANDRSWLPNLVIDPYTGTDFAWAWNAPLLRIPTTSTRHILLTSGRAFALSVGGGLLSLLLRSAPLRNVIVAWSVFVYALLTTLTWPQRWSRAALPPSAPVATA